MRVQVRLVLKRLGFELGFVKFLSIVVPEARFLWLCRFIRGVCCGCHWTSLIAGFAKNREQIGCGFMVYIS